MTRMWFLPHVVVWIFCGATAIQAFVGPSSFTRQGLTTSRSLSSPVKTYFGLATLTESPSPASCSSLSDVTGTSSRLSNHAHGHGGEHHVQIDLDSLGIFGDLMQSPVFWSTCIMCSIVALLLSWEKAVHAARKSLPETLQPVVDSMLIEMGGLGFIGLFLSVAVVEGPLGSFIGAFSETFLGNEEILLEGFEFLHTSFFQVAIMFFAISSITVVSVVKQIESLESVSRAIFDLNGDGEVTLGEVAQVLNVEMVTVDLDGDGILDDNEIEFALEIAPKATIFTELFKTQEDARAEALMVRERLLVEYDIDESTFQLERYFTKIFGRNLEEMVELSPLTWLPLIPIITQGRSIDLARDVISASSSNAFVSCGEFISAPGYLASQTFGVTLSVIWGIWNFWKMVQVKNMLVPTLVRDPQSDGDAVLLPPRYEIQKQMDKFDSSPFPFSAIESIFGKPARNNQEALFGAAGREGPEIYRNSIKLHTWFVVAQLVFIAGQIVARDASALMQGIPETVGRTDLLLPEFGLYSLYSALLIGQLWLIPKTFLDYSLVTSIERLINAEVLTEACVMDGNCVVFPEDEEAKGGIPTIKTGNVTDVAGLSLSGN